MIVSWFSAGVSSAIATKMAIQEHGEIKIIYTHVEDQHEDTLRFVNDCEKWFEKKIEIIQSELKNVNNACRKAGFVNSPYGASCTRLLKIRARMYELGYPNNNCIGCIKGGAGYWNKIKKDFPKVFKNRCEMERDIDGKVFKTFYLDELPENKGRNLKIIVPDCGLFCEQ